MTDTKYTKAMLDAMLDETDPAAVLAMHKAFAKLMAVVIADSDNDEPQPRIEPSKPTAETQDLPTKAAPQTATTKQPQPATATAEATGKPDPRCVVVLDLVAVPEINDNPFDISSASACLEALPEAMQQELTLADARRWAELPDMQQRGHWKRALAIWNAIPEPVRKLVPPIPHGCGTVQSLRERCRKTAKALGRPMPGKAE